MPGAVRRRGTTRWMSVKTATKKGMDGTWEVRPGYAVNLDTGRSSNKSATIRAWRDRGQQVWGHEGNMLYNTRLQEFRPSTLVYRVPNDVKALPEYAEDYAEFRRWKVGKSRDEYEYRWEQLKARWNSLVRLARYQRPRVEIRRRGVTYVVSVTFQYYVVRTDAQGNVVRSAEPNTKNLLEEYVPSDRMDDKEIAEAVVARWLEEMEQDDRTYEVADDVTILTYRVSVREDIQLANIQMRGVGLLYNSMPEVSTTEGQCAIDYLLYEATHQKESRHKGWTRAWLIERLGTEAPTTQQIIDFAKEQEDIVVYALDPLAKVFQKLTATARPRMWLYFVCNNGHLYPVTDKHQHQMIAKTDEMELGQMSIRREDIEKADYMGEQDFVEEGSRSPVVVLDTNDLTGTCVWVMKRTKKVVEIVTLNAEGHMTGFVHPTSKQKIMAGKDWAERMEFCKVQFEMTRMEDFLFRNQGWATISMAMLRNLYLGLPKSHYSHEVQQIFKSYPVVAYRMWDGTEAEESIDIHKCYTSLLLMMDCPYAVFSGFEYPKKLNTGVTLDMLKAGEYYIAKTFYMGRGTIKCSRGFYPLCFVRYVVKRGYVRMSDVTWGVEASQFIPADAFRPFIQHLIDNHRGQLKNLVNTLVGLMGRFVAKKDWCGFTDDFQTMLATMVRIQERNHVSQVQQVGDLWAIREVEESLMNDGHVPIYRSIIAMGKCQLDVMVNELELDPNMIVGYNTDAVKIRKHAYRQDKFSAEIGGFEPEALKGKCFGQRMEMLKEHEEFVCVRKPVRRITEQTPDFMKLAIAFGCLFLGVGGSGKTFILQQIAEMAKVGAVKEVVVVSFTNSAVENLKSRGTEAFTFHSYYGGKRGDTEEEVDDLKLQIDYSKLGKTGVLLIDEYTMLPPSCYAGIMREQKKHGFKVICFGDYRQCLPVDKVKTIYHRNPMFLDMCGNMICEVAYKPRLARYDNRMYDALCDFDKTGKLSHVWNVGIPKTYKHLSWKVKTAERVNAEMFGKWVEEHGSEVVSLAGMKVCAGMPLVCKENDKKRGFFKTQEWVLEEVVGKAVAVSRGEKKEVLSYGDFKHFFDYAFCRTIHKAQGITLSGKYVVHDVNSMSKNLMYTALTRGTCLANVYLATKPNPNRVYRYEVEEQVMADTKTLEAKIGRIYRLRMCGLTYIGKTEQTLAERLEKHRTNPTNSRMKAMIEAGHVPTIELVEEIKFVADAVLKKVEDEWIERELEACGDILNHQVPKKEEERIVEVPVIKESKKFAVKDDEGKKRFEIRCSAKNVLEEDKIARFSYGKRDKEEVRAEAEAHRARMLAKYF